MAVRKYKYFIFLFVATLLLLPLGYTFALEINYPNWSPLFSIGPDTTLDQYIQYIFIFLIISSGTIGIISIVISGFKILVSFGQPEKIGEARKNIWSIVLGIVLLMTSFIILRTINPEFINPSTANPSLSQGVYLRYPTSSGFKYIQAPEATSNTNIYPSGTELYHYCANGSGRNLLVWEYSLTGWGINNNETTVIIPCNGFTSISGSVKSFSRNYEDPGVYFYRTPDCTGYSSGVQKSSGEIKFRYGSEINSMKIVNGLDRSERYGVILNKRSNFAGECSEPIINNPAGSYCVGGSEFPKNLIDGGKFNPYYAYIIKYDPDVALSYGSDNGGIKLFSSNFFAELKQAGGISSDYAIGPKFIYKPATPNDPNPNGNPDKLIREILKKDQETYQPGGAGPSQSGIFTKGGASQFECCTIDSDDLNTADLDPDPDCLDSDGNVQSDPNAPCLKKIVFDGSYYVVLYSSNNQSGERSCDVFTADTVNDISTLDLIAGEKELYKIVVVPKY